MRWGVRRSRSERAAGGKQEKSGKSDAPKKVVGKTKTEGKSAATMSDANMRKVINRLQMEQQYAKLTALPPSKKQKAAKFVSDIALNVAKQQLTNVANDALTKKVGVAMKKQKLKKLGIPAPPNRFPSGPPLTPRLG